MSLDSKKKKTHLPVPSAFFRNITGGTHSETSPTHKMQITSTQIKGPFLRTEPSFYSPKNDFPRQYLFSAIPITGKQAYIPKLTLLFVV